MGIIMSQAFDDFIFERLEKAGVEGKTMESYDKIVLANPQDDNDLNYHIIEIQRHSYLAGFRDGIKMMVAQEVAVDE